MPWDCVPPWHAMAPCLLARPLSPAGAAEAVRPAWSECCVLGGPWPAARTVLRIRAPLMVAGLEVTWSLIFQDGICHPLQGRDAEQG